MKKNRLVLVVVFLVCCIAPSQAQRIAVSTNAVDILSLTPNVEIELSLNHKRSLAFCVDANPFQLNDQVSFKHLSIGGEYRFWIDQIYYAHYVSIAAQISSNDYKIDPLGVSLSGNMCAIGVGYGYSLLISRRVNIVPNISAGVGYDINSMGGQMRIKPMLLNIGVAFQYVIK